MPPSPPKVQRPLGVGSLDAAGMPPLFDYGNTLLAMNVPTNVVVGKVPTPDGEHGVVTIRTPAATLTLVLDKAEVGNWITNLTTLHGALSGSGLDIANGSGLLLPPGYR